MRILTKFAAVGVFLLLATSVFAKGAKNEANCFSKMPYYSLTNPKMASSVTVHFGTPSPDAYGNTTLYAYITDTDVPGFANRVAPPGDVIVYGYITIGSYSTYGQITITGSGGQNYGSVSLGNIGSNGVTLSSLSLSTGSTLGGLPAYINPSVGSLY